MIEISPNKALKQAGIAMCTGVREGPLRRKYDRERT